MANFSTIGDHDALLAYDLHEDGTATFRRVLVSYSSDGTDGFVVDQAGNLWAAVLDPERPGVYAYSPQGVEKAYIGVSMPFNVSFGIGEHSHILYISASTNLYRIPTMKQGYHLPLTPDGCDPLMPSHQEPLPDPACTDQVPIDHDR